MAASPGSGSVNEVDAAHDLDVTIPMAVILDHRCPSQAEVIRGDDVLLTSARLEHDFSTVARLDNNPELVDRIRVIFATRGRLNVAGAWTWIRTEFGHREDDPIAWFVILFAHERIHSAFDSTDLWCLPGEQRRSVAGRR